MSFSLNAANKCESYRDKLKQVQALQRVAHSTKTSVSLHRREQKAWQQWNDCKAGKLKPKAVKSKSAKGKKTQGKAVKKRNNEEIISLVEGSAFDSKKAVVIKAEYQGLQQQAWLNYYQPLRQCLRPTTLKLFAFCLAEKEQQQQQFELEYEK